MSRRFAFDEDEEEAPPSDPSTSFPAPVIPATLSSAAAAAATAVNSTDVTSLYEDDEIRAPLQVYNDARLYDNVDADENDNPIPAADAASEESLLQRYGHVTEEDINWGRAHKRNEMKEDENVVVYKPPMEKPDLNKPPKEPRQNPFFPQFNDYHPMDVYWMRRSNMTDEQKQTERQQHVTERTERHQAMAVRQLTYVPGYINSIRSVTDGEDPLTKLRATIQKLLTEQYPHEAFAQFINAFVVPLRIQVRGRKTMFVPSPTSESLKELHVILETLFDHPDAGGLDIIENVRKDCILNAIQMLKDLETSKHTIELQKQSMKQLCIAYAIQRWIASHDATIDALHKKQTKAIRDLIQTLSQKSGYPNGDITATYFDWTQIYVFNYRLHRLRMDILRDNVVPSSHQFNILSARWPYPGEALCFLTFLYSHLYDANIAKRIDVKAALLPLNSERIAGDRSLDENKNRHNKPFIRQVTEARIVLRDRNAPIPSGSSRMSDAKNGSETLLLFEDKTELTPDTVCNPRHIAGLLDVLSIFRDQPDLIPRNVRPYTYYLTSEQTGLLSELFSDEQLHNVFRSKPIAYYLNTRQIGKIQQFFGEKMYNDIFTRAGLSARYLRIEQIEQIQQALGAKVYSNLFPAIPSKRWFTKGELERIKISFGEDEFGKAFPTSSSPLHLFSTEQVNTIKQSLSPSTYNAIFPLAPSTLHPFSDKQVGKIVKASSVEMYNVLFPVEKPVVHAFKDEELAKIKASFGDKAYNDAFEDTPTIHLFSPQHIELIKSMLTSRGYEKLFPITPTIHLVTVQQVNGIKKELGERAYNHLFPVVPAQYTLTEEETSSLRQCIGNNAYEDFFSSVPMIHFFRAYQVAKVTEAIGSQVYEDIANDKPRMRGNPPSDLLDNVKALLGKKMFHSLFQATDTSYYFTGKEADAIKKQFGDNVYNAMFEEEIEILQRFLTEPYFVEAPATVAAKMNKPLLPNGWHADIQHIDTSDTKRQQLIACDNMSLDHMEDDFLSVKERYRCFFPTIGPSNGLRLKDMDRFRTALEAVPNVIHELNKKKCETTMQTFLLHERGDNLSGTQRKEMALVMAEKRRWISIYLDNTAPNHLQLKPLQFTQEYDKTSHAEIHPMQYELIFKPYEDVGPGRPVFYTRRRAMIDLTKKSVQMPKTENFIQNMCKWLHESSAVEDMRTILQDLTRIDEVKNIKILIQRIKNDPTNPKVDDWRKKLRVFYFDRKYSFSYTADGGAVDEAPVRVYPEDLIRNFSTLFKKDVGIGHFVAHSQAIQVWVRQHYHNTYAWAFRRRMPYDDEEQIWLNAATPNQIELVRQQAMDELDTEIRLHDKNIQQHHWKGDLLGCVVLHRLHEVIRDNHRLLTIDQRLVLRREITLFRMADRSWILPDGTEEDVAQVYTSLKNLMFWVNQSNDFKQCALWALFFALHYPRKHLKDASLLTTIPTGIMHVRLPYPMEHKWILENISFAELELIHRGLGVWSAAIAAYQNAKKDALEQMKTNKYDSQDKYHYTLEWTWKEEIKNTLPEALPLKKWFDKNHLPSTGLDIRGAFKIVDEVLNERLNLQKSQIFQELRASAMSQPNINEILTMYSNHGVVVDPFHQTEEEKNTADALHKKAWRDSKNVTLLQSRILSMLGKIKERLATPHANPILDAEATRQLREQVSRLADDAEVINTANMTKAIDIYEHVRRIHELLFDLDTKRLEEHSIEQGHRVLIKRYEPLVGQIVQLLRHLRVAILFSPDQKAIKDIKREFKSADTQFSNIPHADYSENRDRLVGIKRKLQKIQADLKVVINEEEKETHDAENVASTTSTSAAAVDTTISASAYNDADHPAFSDINYHLNRLHELFKRRIPRKDAKKHLKRSLDNTGQLLATAADENPTKRFKTDSTASDNGSSAAKSTSTVDENKIEYAVDRYTQPQPNTKRLRSSAIKIAWDDSITHDNHPMKDSEFERAKIQKPRMKRKYTGIKRVAEGRGEEDEKDEDDTVAWGDHATKKPRPESVFMRTDGHRLFEGTAQTAPSRENLVQLHARYFNKSRLASNASTAVDSNDFAANAARLHRATFNVSDTTKLPAQYLKARYAALNPIETEPSHDSMDNHESQKTAMAAAQYLAAREARAAAAEKRMAAAAAAAAAAAVASSGIHTTSSTRLSRPTSNAQSKYSRLGIEFDDPFMPPSTTATDTNSDDVLPSRQRFKHNNSYLIASEAAALARVEAKEAAKAVAKARKEAEEAKKAKEAKEEEEEDEYASLKSSPMMVAAATSGIPLSRLKIRHNNSDLIAREAAALARLEAKEAAEAEALARLKEKEAKEQEEKKKLLDNADDNDDDFYKENPEFPIRKKYRGDISATEAKIYHSIRKEEAITTYHQAQEDAENGLKPAERRVCDICGGWFNGRYMALVPKEIQSNNKDGAGAASTMTEEVWVHRECLATVSGEEIMCYVCLSSERPEDFVYFTDAKDHSYVCCHSGHYDCLEMPKVLAGEIYTCHECEQFEADMDRAMEASLMANDFHDTDANSAFVATSSRGGPAAAAAATLAAGTFMEMNDFSGRGTRPNVFDTPTVSSNGNVNRPQIIIKKKIKTAPASSSAAAAAAAATAAASAATFVVPHSTFTLMNVVSNNETRSNVFDTPSTSNSGKINFPQGIIKKKKKKKKTNTSAVSSATHPPAVQKDKDDKDENAMQDIEYTGFFGHDRHTKTTHRLCADGGICSNAFDTPTTKSNGKVNFPQIIIKKKMKKKKTKMSAVSSATKPPAVTNAMRDIESTGFCGCDRHTKTTRGLSEDMHEMVIYVHTHLQALFDKICNKSIKPTQAIPDIQHLRKAIEHVRPV